MKKFLGFALASAALAVSAPASAAELFFNTGGTSSGGGKVFTDGVVTVRVTGWSVNNDDTIVKGAVGAWDQGVGVINSTGDNSHTVDNWGWDDFLVLQFDQAVSLDNGWFTTGWHGMNDTDATIGFNDSALPITTDLGLAGLSSSALDPFNLYESSGSNIRHINPISASANTWLIAASFINADNNPDGFKFKALSYDVEAAVPEPATWAMMLLGFFAVGGMMRSRSSHRRLSAA